MTKRLRAFDDDIFVNNDFIDDLYITANQVNESMMNK
jgi:hypothetical protein